MDIFSKMAKTDITDISLFKTKHIQRNSINTVNKNDKTKVYETGIPNPLTPENLETEHAQTDDRDIKKQQTTIKSELENKVNSNCKKEESSNNKSAEHKTNENSKIINFKTPENINEEAAIKLEKELETAKNNLLPVFPIVRYLKNKCIADNSFADLVNDERKTLRKCFSYVEDEVRKALNSQNGWLDDNEVFAYAETYYMTDEAIFQKIEAEKREAAEKRRAEVEQKRKEQEEKRKKTAIKKKQAEKDKEPDKQEVIDKLNAEEEQLSLL